MFRASNVMQYWLDPVKSLNSKSAGKITERCCSAESKYVSTLSLDTLDEWFFFCLYTSTQHNAKLQYGWVWAGMNPITCCNALQGFLHISWNMQWIALNGYSCVASCLPLLFLVAVHFTELLTVYLPMTLLFHSVCHNKTGLASCL